MTTNVADYIASGNRIEANNHDLWPRDKLDDGWSVSCYYDYNGYYVQLADRGRHYRLYFKIRDDGSRTFFTNYISISREAFLLLLKDNFPIAFEWCLFNLDLIGA